MNPTRTSAPWVTIVTGLPRSGTSVMMQMLAAGGIPPLTDQLRAADEDNPRGYFEFEPVKQIKQDKSWLNDAAGKAVKMVHLLVPELPLDREYRVIFMRRQMEEILASQRKMLDRSGKKGAQMPDAVLIRIFETQVQNVLQWLSQAPRFSVHQVWYRELIADPAGHAQSINALLGGHLNEGAMQSAVDPALYRNKKA
ncbi:MAG TPA: sulfotransferase domain-containing protein [Tepidisphaeraceae bacterium]